MTHLGHFSCQKTSDSLKGNSTKSNMIHLRHFSCLRTFDLKRLQIKDSVQWNSKLLVGTVVIVFNVPFPYNYHFPNFLKSVEPRLWQATTPFTQKFSCLLKSINNGYIFFELMSR
ncbi:hypothetical protein MTR_8g045250 [Medicago truncatula]|uniref:Uncharacterized protein n=1 Tax=Medicago truncatula TaxID=3880 RepID=G7L7R6_MEDTR|nr:hypothetical protein MTR_8g045250 [Medicago truncatula]